MVGTWLQPISRSVGYRSSITRRLVSSYRKKGGGKSVRLQLDKLPQVGAEMIGPYGLRKVDYSQPPPVPILPPPPPARKSAFRRWLPIFLASFAFASGVYIYFNQDEGVYEYWDQVDKGNAPLDFGRGDDEDDDEEFDEDEDEWEDEEEDERKKP